MTDNPTDRDLCESVELQARLLNAAYKFGDERTINDALIRVTDARRMIKNGMYELIYGDDRKHPDPA